MRHIQRCCLVGFAAWLCHPASILCQQNSSPPPTTRFAVENLLPGGDFESGLSGWKPLWTRVPDAGAMAIEKNNAHHGKASLRLEHRAAEDWSLESAWPIAVKAGEVYNYAGSMRLAGSGRAEISVILRDHSGQVIDWTYAGRSTGATDGWKDLRTRFMIPPDATTMTPRVVGHGPAVVHVDDLILTREKGTVDWRTKSFPSLLEVTNDSLQVSFHTKTGAIGVLDLQTGRKWSQKSAGASLLVKDAEKTSGKTIRAVLVDPRTALEFSARIEVDADRPELLIEVSGTGELSHALSFPHPFLSEKGMFLVMPVNEGMSYPVDDASLPPMHYILYGGHGLCMAWWGVTDGKAGLMAIV
jgi:hypothetical protein